MQGSDSVGVVATAADYAKPFACVESSVGPRGQCSSWVREKGFEV